MKNSLKHTLFLALIALITHGVMLKAVNYTVSLKDAQGFDVYHNMGKKKMSDEIQNAREIKKARVTYATKEFGWFGLKDKTLKGHTLDNIFPHNPSEVTFDLPEGAEYVHTYLTLGD